MPLWKHALHWMAVNSPLDHESFADSTASLSLFVAVTDVIRAKSHDRRLSWVPLCCRHLATRLHDYADRYIVQGLELVKEVGICELPKVSLAHNEKAESQS